MKKLDYVIDCILWGENGKYATCIYKVKKPTAWDSLKKGVKKFFKKLP